MSAFPNQCHHGAGPNGDDCDKHVSQVVVHRHGHQHIVTQLQEIEDEWGTGWLCEIAGKVCSLRIQTLTPQN